MPQLRDAATIIPYYSAHSEYRSKSYSIFLLSYKMLSLDDITEDYSSIENSVHLHYFKPELEHAIKELRERSPSKEAYDQFLAEQQAVATRMIKVSRCLVAAKYSLMAV